MRVVRIVAGLVVLGLVVFRVGAAPFGRALAHLDAGSVVAALMLIAIATAASTWRWRVVSERFGVPVGWRPAIGASYRAQFLNSVLPGGVLGDVERAVRQGRGGAIAPAARSVTVERVAGQAVQLVLTLAVVGPFVPGVQGVRVIVGGVVLVGCVAVCAALVVVVAVSRTVRHRVVRELIALRPVVDPGTIARVVVASLGSTAAIAGVVVVAANALGIAAPPATIAGLALVVLLGAGIPLNVGGWGPREGVAGLAFAAAGLGAANGVAVAALVGVLTTIAVLPGAVLLIVQEARRVRARPSRVLRRTS